MEGKLSDFIKKISISVQKRNKGFFGAQFKLAKYVLKYTQILLTECYYRTEEKAALEL